MSISSVRLKKGEDKRIRFGHPWVFSNEIATAITPLRDFTAGEQVLVEAHDGRFLGVAYINPHSLITARIFSRELNQRLDESFLIEQIQNALSLRSTLFAQPYYRLIFAESDALPGLIVDRFGAHLVLQLNTAGMESRKNIIQHALLTVLPDTQSILLRNDSKTREYEQLPIEVDALYGEPPQEIAVIENDIQFLAPLWKGQKTGWFYDHRSNRARLKKYVKNKRVLDVFSYLGAWGIQAACFGATQVDCIDSSQLACDFIAKNAQANQVTKRVNITCDDAFDAMKTLVRKNQQYDVIILDPPAFVKKLKDRKQGLIAYQRVNELALKLLTPNGILFSCSCSMHVSFEDLVEIIQRIATRHNMKVQLLEQGHQAPDHPIHLAVPETNYLKAAIIRKL